jgi:hypothetical protein
MPADAVAKTPRKRYSKSTMADTPRPQAKRPRRAEAGRLTVQAMYSNPGRQDSADERLLEVRTFPEGVTPAQASVLYSFTKNLGNYESVKVSVGVTLPCFAEEIEAAQQQASALAERMLYAKINEVTAQL